MTHLAKHNQNLLDFVIIVFLQDLEHHTLSPFTHAYAIIIILVIPISVFTLRKLPSFTILT